MTRHFHPLAHSQLRGPMTMAAPRRVKSRWSRSSVTILSVAGIAIFSLLRNLHLLRDVGYRDEKEEHFDGLPLFVPPPADPKKDDFFSACLLTMDDNHFLIEWLSYHYHTLPLRRLIVAVDPKSRTSPTTILNRWRPFGMQITEWTDSDYLPETARNVSKQTFAHLNMSDDTRLHHYRQRVFYNECLHTLRNENRTWTMFVDSDEYLTLNQRRIGVNASSLQKPGAILSQIQHHSNQNKSACIMIPRLRFGAVPTSSGSGGLLNTLAFATLSFQNHAALDDLQSNKIGKGVLDLSQVTNESLQVRDPHRLVWEYCPEEGLRILPKDSNLLIHHYLGTWEQFSFRDDVRNGDNDKRKRTFDEFKDVHAGTSDSMLPWLDGFIDNVGLQNATMLLEGVGDVHRWPLVENNTYSVLSSQSAMVARNGSLALDSATPPNRTIFTVDDADAFSACLLVMDENRMLKEWLSYHYHVLPLRHLHVAVHSIRNESSPSFILDKWRSQGMNITEWSAKDYMPDKLLITAQNLTILNKTAQGEFHLARKNKFFEKCMLELKKENRTWTVLADTDEFLVINKQVKSRFNITNSPPIEQPGSVMTLLRQELAKNNTALPTDTPCIRIPRLRYGSITEQGNSNDHNVSSLVTLRNHATPKPSNTGRTILDVSKLGPADMRVSIPRRPLFSYCPKSGIYTKTHNSLFVVNHYSGSSDTRGKRSSKAMGLSDDLANDDDNSIRPWLGGFVKDVGMDKATELLEGVGDIHHLARMEPTKNETLVPDHDTFSACLLVMDDSHVLIEWLAYHFHVMPLRHLIVAVDPRSITSPSEILARWRDHGMTIEEWHDKDFMDEKLLTVAENMAQLNKTQIIELHRSRQRRFYEMCMKRHKRKGRKWTMLTDTDEFLLINKRATDRFNVTDAPPMEQPASVMTFLKQERAKKITEMPKRTSCIMIPRLRFGSGESKLEKVNFRVPPGFNASAFTTLRHRKHAEPRLSIINKTGKVIIDVSRLHPKRIKVQNPHRPLWAYCPKSHLYTLIKDNLFVIHHYSGTWEQYTYREDYRAMKTKEEFDRYNARQLDDDAIRPWLEGFVQDKGHEAASHLLKEVGELPPKNTSTTAVV